MSWMPFNFIWTIILYLVVLGLRFKIEFNVHVHARIRVLLDHLGITERYTISFHKWGASTVPCVHYFISVFWSLRQHRTDKNYLHVLLLLMQSNLGTEQEDPILYGQLVGSRLTLYFGFLMVKVSRVMVFALVLKQRLFIFLITSRHYMQNISKKKQVECPVLVIRVRCFQKFCKDLSRPMCAEFLQSVKIQ
jgi:hypothetical protein